MSNTASKKGFREITARVMLAILIISGAIMVNPDIAFAKATTVTLKYGKSITYGSGWTGHTSMKWVTHIDGEAVDLDDEPGVSRSYAYCVQPAAAPPAEGTYSVTVVDDDDTGKISKMRKFIYYSPGSYGYYKVTKKRWFSNYSTNDAYAIAHLALSWIYDGYSNGSDLWGGAPSSMVSDTKDMVNDLKNLPDPPEDFEVFWVKVSGKQDVFGAFYHTEYGKIKLTKASSLPSVSNGNECYSLAGAEFTLYTDEGCKEGAKFKDGSNAVLKTKADGTSPEYEIETGEYFIKETKAPEGYAIDSKAYKVEVKKDKTYTYSCKDTPIMNIVNLLLTKKPQGYPHNHGEGDATLAGAVYRFNYYDGHYSTAAAAEGSGKPTALWFFTTDEKGEIAGANPKPAEGYTSSALYKDAAGKVAFPLGTYVIQEVSQPTGYLLNNEKVLVKITEDGTDKDHVKTYNEKAEHTDVIIRGGVKLAKIDNDLDEAYAQGDATLAGAEFTIYNKSKESIMIAGNEVAKDSEALVIATNADGIAFAPANALPYGTYFIKETKPALGYLLNTEWSKTFSIRKDGEIIDLSGDKVREAVERGGVQIVKRDKELQKSEALGGANLKDIVFTIKNVSAHDVVVRKDIGNTADKVDWKKLASKKDLFEAGTINRVKPGEDVGKIVTHWNEEKKAYTAETLADDLPYGTYTIRESKTNNTYQRTDKTEHKFEVREDGTLYAYDSEGMDAILTFDNYVYRSDMQGTKIGDGDSKRFSYVPFKITSVANDETHVVVADKNGFFSTKDRRTKDGLDEDEDADTSRKVNPFDDLLTAKDIKKADLEKRQAEILMGVWFGTGEFGSKAEMNSDFGALPYDSYVIEELPFDGNEGYTLQKFFFTVDEKSQNGFVDLETITNDIPEIGTTASVNGKKENVEPSKTIKLTDRIKYKGLGKAQKYVAKGVLMDKSTGKPVLDPAGKEVTAEKEFTSLIGTGWVNVTFEFDATNLYGKETVVFEKVYDVNGHLVAKHEDITDEDQTVTWEKPSIGTTLADGEGNKTVVASEKTVLVDTVSYKGLDKSQWYVVEGTLMVKETGDPLVENGSPITVVSEPFQPKDVIGTVDVTFIIDTRELIGKELVAFETCYRLEGYKKGDDITKLKKTKIAEHKDINDKGQTVKITEPEKPGTPVDSPDTGDKRKLWIYIAIFIATLVPLSIFVGREIHKKHKQRKEDKEMFGI